MSQNKNHEEIQKQEQAMQPQEELQVPQASKKEEHHLPESESFKALQENLKKIPEVEKKIELVIQFMSFSLAQAGSPHFRDFWEAKKTCQEFFKENINPTSRVHFWATYSELSREARRLKEIFDEQSAFACEQIEIAVKSVENEIADFERFLQQVTSFQFSADSAVLAQNYAKYDGLQRELVLLNTYATRVSSLRKELIKTEMRIRDKNKFFERLSKLGDLIFPRRKVLMQEVSQLFIQDVEGFIKNTFDHELKTVQLFSIREEIKALQSSAKDLTLNTEAFSKTRACLSECWDSLKTIIDERKKEEHEQKQEFRQHRDEFAAQLDELKKKCEEKAVGDAQAYDELEQVIHKMRTTTLGRHEIRLLREKVTELRDIIASTLKSAVSKPVNKSANAVAKEALHEKEQSKIRAYEALQKKISEILLQVETQENELLSSFYEQVTKEVATSSFPRMQKLELEKELHKLRDAILEKKEKKLLTLPSDTRQAISELKLLLNERKAQRQEIKELLESHRRAKGSSGFDFAEALQANEVIAEEKARLEKIATAIDEIEDQIAKLEG